MEKVRERDAISHVSEHGRTSHSHAKFSEIIYNRLQERAGQIGMVVNDQKTQMPTNNKSVSYLTTADGTRIESGMRLKILGYTFDGHPGPGAQIDEMVSKFRRRLWSLRYLRRAGMEGDDLCKAYVTYLRPLLEYICLLYTSPSPRDGLLSRMPSSA